MPIIDRINALSGVNTGGSIEDALIKLEETLRQGGGIIPGKSELKIKYNNEDETVVFTAEEQETE